MLRSALVLLGVVACVPLPERPKTPTVTPLKQPACVVPRAPVRTLKVDATTGDDGASGLCATASTCTPWKTLAHAATSAQPGDLVTIAGGTWSEQVDFAVDGTADRPIVFTAAPGETVIVNATWRLRARSWLTFSGLTFDSPNADAWVLSEGANHHLSFIGNAFDSHAPNRNNGAFVGLGLTGTNVTLCGNAFGSWLGDQVSANAVDRLLVEHNDWSQASANHALLVVVGRNVVIRGNAFRNPWHRAIHITDRSDDNQSEDMLVENNTFIDSDWVKGAPHPSVEEQSLGGNEVVRFLGARGIFRNNLLVGNHEGNDWACHGILSFQTFHSTSGIDTHRYTRFRVYGNTFDSNKTTSINFYQGIGGVLDDNQFKNNVITRPERYAISVCGKGVPWQGYRFERNVLPGDSLHFPDTATTGSSVAVMEQSDPMTFLRNLGEAPTFVNEQFGATVATDFTTYSLTRLPEAYAAYRLTTSSVGHAQAAPLTTVRVAAVQSPMVQVDDALWLSDGFGVTAGDLLRIGANATARVLSRDVEARAVTLDGR